MSQCSPTASKRKIGTKDTQEGGGGGCFNFNCEMRSIQRHKVPTHTITLRGIWFTCSTDASVAFDYRTNIPKPNISSFQLYSYL